MRPLFYGRWSPREPNYALRTCCGEQLQRWDVCLGGLRFDVGDFAPLEGWRPDRPAVSPQRRHEGDATLTYLIGAPVTVLGLADRSGGDPRGNNWSQYLLPGDLGWGRALRAARCAFPAQMGRLRRLPRLVEVRALQIGMHEHMLTLMEVTHG